ncbi:MAG: hypothetical protein QXX95_05725 [Nitrososphaerales archaeon]
MSYVSQLGKVAPNGAFTLIANTTSTINLGAANTQYTNTLSSVSHTVQQGYILDLRIVLKKAAVTQSFILAVGFSDTPTRMEIIAQDHFQIISTDSPIAIYDTSSGTFKAKAKDAFGYYDLSSRITSKTQVELLE